MAESVKSRVASGEYASESEVIRDGLRTLLARDRAVESWLRDEVVPAYEELKANPSSAGSVEQVRVGLRAKHQALLNKVK
jgi:antitoxin ParD1/3/4